MKNWKGWDSHPMDNHVEWYTSDDDHIKLKELYDSIAVQVTDKRQLTKLLDEIRLHGFNAGLDSANEDASL